MILSDINLLKQKMQSSNSLRNQIHLSEWRHHDVGIVHYQRVGRVSVMPELEVFNKRSYSKLRLHQSESHANAISWTVSC